MCLKNDENSRVACEVLAAKGNIIVAGEITSTYEPDVFAVVRKVLSDVGTGTFLPNEMEQDWEGEGYHELEEEQVLFDGADLIPYVSEIQEKIAEYSRVGHEDDKTDNLMDYFDGSAAIKEKVLSAVPSVKEADGVLYGCTILELIFFRDII